MPKLDVLGLIVRCVTSVQRFSLSNMTDDMGVLRDGAQRGETL